ncbi:MAG: extracellular solute-binding protein [Oscillospiraceae bacterium]|nr:extracellular solute-binding protein [Oscillospiraceae bacterium]
MFKANKHTRKHRPAPYLFISALLILALALAGCGTGGGGATTAAATTAAAAEATTAAAAGATEAAATTVAGAADAGATTAATTTTAAAAADEDDDPDLSPPVTLTMAMPIEKGGGEWGNRKPWTVQEMEKELNIVWELRGHTPDQDQLMYASGDLADIVMAHRDFYTQIIEGGLVMPLDDLVEQYAPDIKEQTYKLDYARKYLSHGTGLLYGFTCFTGSDGNGFYPQIGFHTRWDLYKELGAPEMASHDDILELVDQLVRENPTTPDGQKVYGFGVFNDWGTWPFGTFPINNPTANTEVSAKSVTFRADGTEFYPMIDIDSGGWQNLSMFNKANQMGLFDKDSLTQSSSEYANKCTNGQYMIICAGWWMTAYNLERRVEDPNTLNGYQHIPFKGGKVYCNNLWPAGASAYMYMISSKCQNPEAAMKLLNYLNSYDGIRFLMCGSVEAGTIEMVEGKPEMTAEIIEKTLADSEDVRDMFYTNENAFGFTVPTIHPGDGQPLNLRVTDRGFSLQCSPMDTDYSNYYGATYPAGVLNKFISEGYMTDNRYMPSDVTNAMPPDTDSIARIRNLVTDIYFKTTATAILAPNDAAFMEVFEQNMKDLKDSGFDLLVEFDRNNYLAAKADFE